MPMRPGCRRRLSLLGPRAGLGIGSRSRWACPGTRPGSDYFHSEQVDGSKHFGIWPLSEAAQACFGTPDWPADRVVPQMSLEFEVSDADAVQSAAEELRQRGFDLLHDRRKEPWGQTVARLQSEEGVIIGISFAPALHD